MYLTHLSLTNFRNFARLDADLPTGTLVLVGSNAQGKTSLLEAIYLLSTFTSFHADHDRQLIHFLTAREPLAVARIVADYWRGGRDHRLEVRIIQEQNGFNGSARLRKEVLLDGVKQKLGDVVGHFNAVLFLPQMLNIIDGSPENRPVLAARMERGMKIAYSQGGYETSFVSRVAPEVEHTLMAAIGEMLDV